MVSGLAMFCIWGALLAGSVLQGSAGFGIGLLAVGFMTLFLSVKDTTLIILALTVLMSGWAAWRLRESVRWTTLSWVLIGTLAGRILSFLYIHRAGDLTSAKQWLGVILIAMVALLFLGRSLERGMRKLADSRTAAALTGLFGGFIGGAFAVGGPVYAVYFMVIFEDKRAYNANLQIVFILSNLFTLLIHGASGDFGGVVWFYVLTGIVPVWIGFRLGFRLFARIDRKRLRYLASAIVVASGLNMLGMH